jgi:hypothetical protein
MAVTKDGMSESEMIQGRKALLSQNMKCNTAGVKTSSHGVNGGWQEQERNAVGSEKYYLHKIRSAILQG